MSDKTDYYNVTIPDDTPPSEYHWTQRRAEILELIIRAGTPKAINQSRLAERYDTCQSNIHKDLDRLKDYIKEHVGRDIKFTSELLYRKAVDEYVKRGEYNKAVQVLESWNNWLFDIGVEEKAPVKSKVEQESTVLVEYVDPYENTEQEREVEGD